MQNNPNNLTAKNSSPEKKENSGILNQVKYFRDKMSLFMRRDLNNEEREKEQLNIKSEYRNDNLTNEEKERVEAMKKEQEEVARKEIERIQGKIIGRENSNLKEQETTEGNDDKATKEIENEKERDLSATVEMTGNKDVEMTKEGKKSFFSKAKNFVVDKVIRGSINILKAPLEIAYDIGTNIGSSIKKSIELSKIKDLYSGDSKKIRYFLIDKKGLEKVLGITANDPMYTEIKMALEDNKGALVIADRIIENMRHLYNKSVDKKSHEETEKIVGKENITDPYSNVTTNQNSGAGNGDLNRVKNFGVAKILKDPLNQLAELTQLFSGDFILKGMTKTDYSEVLKSNEMKRAILADLTEYNQNPKLVEKELEKKGSKNRLTDLASSSLLSMPVRYLNQGGRFLTLGAGILAGPAGTSGMIALRGLFEKSFEQAKKKIVQEKGITNNLNQAFGTENISNGLINSLKKGPAGVDTFLQSIQNSLSKESIKDLASLESGLKSLAEVIQGGELNIFNENPVEKRNVLYKILETTKKAKAITLDQENLSNFSFKDIITEKESIQITGTKEKALKRLRNGLFKTFASVATVVSDPKQMKSLFLDVLDKVTFNATVGAETTINNIIHNATTDALSNVSNLATDVYETGLIATEAMHSFTTLPLDLAHAQIAGSQHASEALPPHKDQSSVNFLTGMFKFNELQQFFDEQNTSAHEKVKTVNSIRDQILAFNLKDQLTSKYPNSEISNDKLKNKNENREKENANYKIIFDSIGKEKFVSTLMEMWRGKDQQINILANKIYDQKDYSDLPNIEIINFSNPNIEAGFSATKNTIFASTDAAEIPAVYAEIGHYFDTILNDGKDYAGDEGDLFEFKTSGREYEKVILHENDVIILDGIGEIEMMEKTTFTKLNENEKSAISIKIDSGHEKDPKDNYKLEIKLNDKDLLVSNAYRGIRTALVLENPDLIKNKEKLLFIEDYIADKLSKNGDGGSLSKNSYTGEKLEITKALINEASSKADELDKKGLLKGLNKYVKTIDWTSWERSSEDIINELKNEGMKNENNKDLNPKIQDPNDTKIQNQRGYQENLNHRETAQNNVDQLTNIKLLGNNELTLNFAGANHSNIFIPNGMNISETETDREIKISLNGKIITGRISEKENILYFNDIPFHTGNLQENGEIYSILMASTETESQDKAVKDPRNKNQKTKETKHETQTSDKIVLEKNDDSYNLKFAGTDSLHLIDKIVPGLTIEESNNNPENQKIKINYNEQEVAQGKVSENNGTLNFEYGDNKTAPLIKILRDESKIEELQAEESKKIENQRLVAGDDPTEDDKKPSIDTGTSTTDPDKDKQTKDDKKAEDNSLTPPEKSNDLIYAGDPTETAQITAQYNSLVQKNKDEIKAIINTQRPVLKNKLDSGAGIDSDKTSQSLAYILSGWENATTNAQYEIGAISYKAELQKIKEFKDDAVEKIKKLKITPDKITSVDFNKLIYIPKAQESLANKYSDKSVEPGKLIEIFQEVKLENVENILVNKIDLNSVNGDNQELFQVFQAIENKSSAGKLINRIAKENPKIITQDFLEDFIDDVVNNKKVYTDSVFDNTGSFNTLLYAMPMEEIKKLVKSDINNFVDEITDQNAKSNFEKIMSFKLDLRDCLPQEILSNTNISPEAFKFLFDKNNQGKTKEIKIETDEKDKVLNINSEKIHLKGIDKEIKIDLTEKTLRIIAKDNDGTSSLLEFDKGTLKKVTEIGVTSDDFTSDQDKKIILNGKVISLPAGIKSFKLTDPEKLTTELQIQNGLILNGNILPDKTTLTIKTDDTAEEKYKNQEVNIKIWIEENKDRRFSDGMELNDHQINNSVDYSILGQINKSEPEDNQKLQEKITKESTELSIKDQSVEKIRTDLLTDLQKVYPNITMDPTESTDLKTTLVIDSMHNGKISVVIEIGENETIKSLTIDKQPVQVNNLESAKNLLKQYLTSLNEDQLPKSEKSDQSTDLVNLADFKYSGLRKYLKSIDANVEQNIGPIITQMNTLNVDFFIQGNELIIKFKDNPKEILRGEIGVDQNQGKLTLAGKIITSDDLITLFIKEKTNNVVTDGMISNENPAINITGIKLDSSLQDFDIKNGKYSFIYAGKYIEQELPEGISKIEYIPPSSTKKTDVPLLVFKNSNNTPIGLVDLNAMIKNYR